MSSSLTQSSIFLDKSEYEDIHTASSARTDSNDPNHHARDLSKCIIPAIIQAKPSQPAAQVRAICIYT